MPIIPTTTTNLSYLFPVPDDPTLKHLYTIPALSPKLAYIMILAKADQPAAYDTRVGEYGEGK